MDLDGLIQRYQEDDRVQTIVQHIRDRNTSWHIQGGVGSVYAFLATGLFKNLRDHHYLFVLPTKDEAGYFYNDLQNLFDRKEPYFFADSYKKPGKFETASRQNILMRTEVLNGLFNTDKEVGELVVTYPEALIEKVVNQKTFQEHTLTLQVEETIDPEFLREVFQEYGFERADFVYEPGQYSIRGGIIDIFSYGQEYPYRIELFDDEIESIRLFNPEDQLSVQQVNMATITPDFQTQFQSPDYHTLLDLLPEKTVVWAKDFPHSVERLEDCEETLRFLAQHLEEESEDDEEEEEASRPAPNLDKFASAEQLQQQLKSFPVVETGQVFHFGRQGVTTLKTAPQPPINKDFNILIQKLRNNERKGILNYLFSPNSRQIERFYEIFEDKGFEGQVYPLKASLHEGFIDKQLSVACLTDHQIFNRFHTYKLRKGFSKSQAMAIKELKKLKAGDYVTHVDHGVGKYQGLQKITVNGTVQEAVRIHYKDDDILYVNINALHKVSRFVSKDGSPPSLNKLGSGAWDRLKRKTKKKVKEIAKDLIKLYAERKATKGYQFSPDSYLQAALEASFLHLDTPDQEKATEDVKKDMESPHPMDRLICGDVGFGKTEVAIRAAFKAVTDSKQVAMLVPTTILAFQHYKTFSERLEDMPCSVDYINRFKSRQEQKEILEKVERGEVDILIGTHRILGDDVKFHDLGLLIVDEEQKFGVTHKEKIRKFKVNVGTLALSATPIPRTLQFSLMGARDLSVINTPPPNRQAIQTELHTYDDEKIREAIEFEVNRDGQVYLIHNRIKDIRQVEQKVRSLCPEVKVAVAHGQMKGKTLENIMVDFIDGKYDVLLCTAIIESGIDIPNVNTIIINNAHQFGLSDLHQLRGRVGRSNKKAYCLLLAPTYLGLTPEARRRLKTIEEFADLGSGFSIAMRDLDIRGAGNLLGPQQSGFIAEMGLETYHKILDESVQELKENEFQDLFKEELKQQKTFVRECKIETDREIYIPDEYVTNINERLSLYTQINNAKTEKRLESLAEELEDRFGPIPDTVHELFNAIRLRWLAKEMGFERLVFKNNKLKCFFIEDENSTYYETDLFQNLLAHIQTRPEQFNLKQKYGRLILVYDNVDSLRESIDLLQQTLEASQPEESTEEQESEAVEE